MTIDWVTWSIWVVGFAIMVLWIFVPIREFRRLVLKKRAEAHLDEPSEPSTQSRRSSA